ncbi:MAG: radical SAM protein [Thermodesulfobacteriota bacterium]
MATIQFPNNGCACGDSGNSGSAILTLPVAPQSIARIRFDQIDKQARAVPPDGALNWVDEHLSEGTAVAAVDLAGPGDPLAEIDSTMETMRLIRQYHPDIILSLTTLGINAEKYAEVLGESGLSCVTLLVDAVDQEVANKLYAWIRPDRKTISLGQATPMLMKEQARAVEAFKAAGCTVNVRTTVYPGLNDQHIEKLARVMAEHGAEKLVLVPYAAPSNMEEKLLTPPDDVMMQQLLQQATEHLQTTLQKEKVYGLVSGCSSTRGACESITDRLPGPSKARPNVAVVSMSGMEVDLHLGQAYQVLIYGPREDGLTCLLGTRPVPEPGSGSSRWEELAGSLPDCFAILATSAGESPRQILGEQGITLLITDGEIEGSIDLLYGGTKKREK